MARTYAADRIVTKSGKPFSKQTIYKMLHNRMYLGEIVHKGQGYPGQHQGIIPQEKWDAVHALIATDDVVRRRATNDRYREPVLLRGLLFTYEGERLLPTYTEKKGKIYRYYAPSRQLRFGAWASRHAALPAEPVEKLVVEQVVAALSAPHLVQAVWDCVQSLHPDLPEPEVVLQLRHLGTIWQQLFLIEQCRLVKLLIERVVISENGIEIFWHDNGWKELAVELQANSIGAELAEWEETI